MQRWQIITAAVTAPTAAFIVLAAFFLYLFCFCLGGGQSSKPEEATGVLLRVHNNTFSNSKNKRVRVQRQYSYSVDAFSWENHPSLVAETLEHGWTTFAFTYNFFDNNNNEKIIDVQACNSPRPWRFCAGGEKEAEPEITWEAVSGSNLMQKIRLNPDSACTKFMALRTALPLPGPALGNFRFPQEAYFEITVVSEGSTDEEVLRFDDVVEDDRVKLLQLVNLDGCEGEVIGVEEGQRLSDIAGSNEKVSGEMKMKKKRIIALGQGVSGSHACALPGLDPGSVGFYSTGAFLLNGHRPENEEEELCSWGDVGSIIGCGFDPATKCVFFTFNGALVRTILCRTSEFGNPLYPTIAANYDVTVLVNFGQRSFCYAAANSARLSNPSSPNLEDSKEYFSMDRIDPLWLADKMVWPAKNASETEDSELFEIVLDEESTI